MYKEYSFCFFFYLKKTFSKNPLTEENCTMKQHKEQTQFYMTES